MVAGGQGGDAGANVFRPGSLELGYHYHYSYHYYYYHYYYHHSYY